MEPFETWHYRGHKIEIIQDDCPLHPREDMDNLGRLVCFHRRYNLGDEHEFDSPQELVEYINENEEVASFFPVYLMDHSGLSLSITPFGCRWDSGQVGYIYATYEDIKTNFVVDELNNKHLEMTDEILKSEVRLMDEYLRGNVWIYTIYDPDGYPIDTCGGFYGFVDESGLMEEVYHVIDKNVENEQKKRNEKLKALIRHRVPYHYRQDILKRYNV